MGSSVKARTMKGASGHRNSRQASPEPGAAAGKPLPTDFPPSYTEQEQNVRVVYLPASNFGPKCAKVVCSSCQASVTTTTSSRPSMMAWAASCVLLHHALALLLCPIQRRQLQRC